MFCNLGELGMIQIPLLQHEAPILRYRNRMVTRNTVMDNVPRFRNGSSSSSSSSSGSLSSSKESSLCPILDDPI